MDNLFRPGLQATLAAVAAFWLWRIGIRLMRSNGPAVSALIAAGFLARAFAGQLFFWVSYLGLPFGRGLQLGGGFWFFAPDARGYLDRAADLSSRGIGAILNLDRTTASPFYVQALASAVGLFGPIASVGLLVNLYFYLLSCAVVVAWAKSWGRRGSFGELAAVAGLSFSPSLVLWALQPLKDTLCLFLMIGFFAAAAAWYRQWRQQARWPALSLLAAALWLLVYGLAGIRAYLALTLWMVMGVGFVLMILTPPGLRGRLAAPACFALFVILSRALDYGGGPYLPETATRIVRFQLPQLKSANAAMDLDRARDRFGLAGGATLISEGTGSAKPPTPTSERAGSAKPPTPISERTSSAKPPTPTSERAGSAKPPTPISERTGSAKPPTPISERTSSAKPPTPISERRASATGLVALVLPRFLAQRLGLLQVGGGRGLWAFAEADTLWFDGALFLALWSVGRERWRIALDPVPALIGLTTAGLAVAMAYVVTNYGTLFRLREMVFVGLCLIPLAVGCAKARWHSPGE